MSDNEIKKPREWWIGRTESGFDKWLTSKHPDETECRNAFICSDASEKCVEYIPVVELSALEYAQAEIEELKQISSRNADNWVTFLKRSTALETRETELLNLVREMMKQLTKIYTFGYVEKEEREDIEKIDATLKRLGVEL